MSNKEKYKQAFSAIHISDDFSLEVKKVKNKNKLFACVAVLAFILTSTAVVYAADIGGIQRTIQLWIQGEQSDVTIDFDGDGNYEMHYIDEDGNERQQGGGGIAYDIFGNERPLTEEELLEQMNSPEVEYKDDGTVWVYWYDQKVDITDKFEDGVCYVEVVNDDEVLYMTVTENGYSASPDGFLEP